MVKKNIERKILILILIFAGFLYSFKLSTIPSGIYVDEAVAAYDSYSILQTGADHYGKFLPISFRFFGAYTPGFFVYLNTIPIKIFGFNNFSIRFISVVSTLVQLVFLYLITKFFAKNKTNYSNLISLFFISITPWVVFNARLGYEVTLAQTFLTIAVYFLLVSINKPNFLLLSSLFFTLSVHTAHTQKVLAPLIIIFSFFILKIWRYPKKIIFFSLLILIITQIPNFYLMTTKSFWVKNSSIGNNYSTFIDNLNYQFFQTISPKTWFNQSPDIDFQHQIPEISLFYSWMFLPFIIGFLKIFFAKEKSIESKFIIGFFIISLIPGILSGRFMSTQRLIPLIIPFSVFIFLGIEKIIQFIKNKHLNGLLIVGFAGISLLFLFRSYFILLPNLNASAWNYGADQVAQFILENPDKHFIIDNTRHSREYILYLYYLKYDPRKFNQEIGDNWSQNYYQNINNITNVSFSNIEVRPVSGTDFHNPNNIIIGDALLLPNSDSKNVSVSLVKEIKYPNQKTAYKIYQSSIIQ